MNLGVQYYRPPFPESPLWEDDLRRIKESGLNTVQLWIVWAWVESRPGEFDFSDYDRLIELAKQAGLRLVLSLVAEIQPHWIHQEVPGSEMIDHMGNRVISSNRNECHFGLTPGGCTDHAQVWERMAKFLSAAVTRYRTQDHLIGWDIWNELRWNVQADGYVCFCPHTLEAFHEWLRSIYGDLDGLNQAWKRRYGKWEEVTPGKLPDRTYTEMMAWQHFLTSRCNVHGKARYDLVKGLDPSRLVTLHAGDPTPQMAGGDGANFNYALSRGNDWAFADTVDGIGCSSFPRIYEMDDADFSVRMGFLRSAAGDKPAWLSELQGGGASLGFQLFPPIEAFRQQRWVWNGIANGADTILFWCWRDEVFGRESAGFGLIGNDGLVQERIEAMKHTESLSLEWKDLFSAYRPLAPEVGVLFSPSSYYLNWAQDGNGQSCRKALEGYCRALTLLSIPYLVVEEDHLEALSGLKVLFLPRTLVTTKKQEEKLIQFVHNGGTLVCESECGAYSREGIYRVPQDRFLSRILKGHEAGRRLLRATKMNIEPKGSTVLRLPCRQWLTPWTDFPGTAWSRGEDGTLAGEAEYGKGRVIYCGSYFGEAYAESREEDFESFIRSCVVLSGCSLKVTVINRSKKMSVPPLIQQGRSGGKTVLFLFSPQKKEQVTLLCNPDLFEGKPAIDLLTREKYMPTDSGNGHLLTVKTSQLGLSILTTAGV